MEKEEFLALIGLAPDLIVQERIRKLNVEATQLRHMATLRSQKVKLQHAASRVGSNSLRSRSPIMTRHRNEQVRQLREVLERPHEANGVSNEVESTIVPQTQGGDPDAEDSSSETPNGSLNNGAGHLFSFKRPPVSDSSSELSDQPVKINSNPNTNQKDEVTSFVTAWLSRASALSKRAGSPATSRSPDTDTVKNKRRKVDYLKQRKSSSPVNGKSSPDMSGEVSFLSKAFGRPPSPPLPSQRGGKQPMDLELFARKRQPDPDKAEHALLFSFGSKRRLSSSFAFHSGKAILPEKHPPAVGTRTSDRVRPIERKWNTSSVVLAAIRRKKALNNIGFGTSRRKRTSEDHVGQSSEHFSRFQNRRDSGMEDVEAAGEKHSQESNRSSSDSGTPLKFPSPPPMPSSDSRHVRKRLPGSLFVGASSPCASRLSNIIERAKRSQQRRTDPLGVLSHNRFERKPAIVAPTIQMPLAALFAQNKSNPSSRLAPDEPPPNHSGASLETSQMNGCADSLSHSACPESASSSPLISSDRRRHRKRRHTAFAPLLGTAVTSESVPEAAKPKEDEARLFSFSHSHNPGQSWTNERTHSVERSAPSILQRSSRSERIGLPTLLHLRGGREPNRFLGPVSLTELVNAQAQVSPPPPAPAPSLHTSSIAPQPVSVAAAASAAAANTSSSASMLPPRATSAPQLVLPGMTLPPASESVAPRQQLTALQLLKQKKQLGKQTLPASQTAIC